MKMDTDTVVAGILHDIVEDTLIPIADIEYNFGKTVASFLLMELQNFKLCLMEQRIKLKILEK